MAAKVSVAPKGMGLNDFVAMQEGFFRDEGIEVETVVVRHQRHLVSDSLAPAFHFAADQIDIGDGANLKAFEVDEDGVASLVVGDPFRKAQAEKQLFKPDGLRLEDQWVHRPRIGYDRPKAHLTQNVLFNINSRCVFRRTSAGMGLIEVAPSRGGLGRHRRWFGSESLRS